MAFFLNNILAQENPSFYVFSGANITKRKKFNIEIFLKKISGWTVIY